MRFKWEQVGIYFLVVTFGIATGLPIGITMLVAGLVAQCMLIFVNKYYPAAFLLTGGLLNNIAVFANGGQMPVLIPDTGWAVLTDIHKVMTPDAHVKILCDIFQAGNFAMYSIGDVFIAVIFPLTALGFYVYNRIKWHGNTHGQSKR
jgi:hypothetical protein